MTLDETTLAEIEAEANELANLERSKADALAEWADLTAARQGTRGDGGQKLFKRISALSREIELAHKRIGDLFDLSEAGLV